MSVQTDTTSTSTIPTPNVTVVDIDVTSLSILSVQVPSSVSFVLLGILGLVGNSTLCYVIIRNKSLQSNFYLKLLHMAFADAFFSFFSLIVGCSRLAHFMTDNPETATPVHCSYTLAPWIFFKNASPGQALCIGLDRVLCVLFPNKFPDLPIRYSQLINAAMWVVCAVAMSSVFSFFNTKPLVPNCTTGNTFIVWVNLFTSSYGLTMDLLTTIAYACLLAILLFRLQRAKSQGKSVSEMKKSLQFRAVVTSFMLMGVYTTVCLSGEMLQLLTNSYDPIPKSKVQPYVITVMLVGCNLAFAINVMRKRDIQEAIGVLLPRRLKVGTIGTHSSVVQPVTFTL